MELQHEALYPLKNRSLFHQTSEHVHTFTEPQDLGGVTQNGTEFMGRCFRSFYYQALNSTVERYPAFWTTHLQKQTGDSQAQESRCRAAGLQLTLHSQLGSSVAPKYCRKKLHSIVTFCLSALPRCTNFNLCNLNYTKLNNIAYKMQIYCTCATQQ